ncbi:MAG TPA: hypothetical protein PLF40_01555 [Kofleriaceae bacterium]|nr:hypothetical protein [Kofleriaceae bacterium]
MTLAEIEAALRQGDVDQLIAMVERDAGVGRQLARALRRAAYTLQNRPELALPALQRVCMGTPELTPLLAAWATEWASWQRGAWFKALTAPLYELESALLSEYPDPEPIAAMVRPLLRVDNINQPTGFFAVIDDERNERWLFPKSGDDSFDAIVRLNANEVIVAGWFCDYDGVVARLDLAAQRIVWRRELGRVMWSVQVQNDGRVLVLDSLRGYFLDPADGQTLASFPAPKGKCTLSLDGTALNVKNDGVCREFLVEQLCQSTGNGVPRSRSGFISAEFSIDGSLLVTGLEMWNAHTGAHIASLDGDSGGYLEGGPPKRGRRVVPRGFIETSMRGTHRWGANGQPLHRNDARFVHWHELTFSDDGTWMAIKDRSGKLEIRDVDSQAVKVASAVMPSKHFIWVGDSDAVAYISEPAKAAEAEARTVRLLHLDGRDELVSTLPDACALRVSCDGETLAVVGVTTVELWHLASLSSLLAEASGPTSAGVVALPAELQSNAKTRDRATRALDALDELLHQQHGYRVRAHPWIGSYANGMFTITDERTCAVVAEVPCDGPLLPDPTGTRWASRTELFALVGAE